MQPVLSERTPLLFFRVFLLVSAASVTSKGVKDWPVLVAGGLAAAVLCVFCGPPVASVILLSLKPRKNHKKTDPALSRVRCLFVVRGVSR
jgi:hypothetical protein